MFPIGTWVWIIGTDDHGKIEEVAYEGGYSVRLDSGELTGPLMSEELMAHADYPHTPGTLYNCEPCEIIMDMDEDL